MQNNISNIKTEDCCGCGACYNKCPTGAISMQENNEGFLYPVIDEIKCTNCGLCQKACPSINVKYKNNPKPDCYAAMADDEIRMKSSSGGMFTLLANYILDKGGYVCGAAFDDDWNVHHIIIDNKEDLSKLRGSKYVQSDTENCYKEIKKLLDADKYVLFSGCPCQVAGLYTFLGKDYEKLLSVDILCHGAPSQGVWKKYLAENFQDKKILNINFRDKSEIGWSCSDCTITLSNNEKIVSNNYTKLFHDSIIIRQSCEECQYSKLPRIADITLGDFWGISNYNKDLNDGKGTSFVLLNSSKGKNIFKSINVKSKKIKLKNDYNNGNLRFNSKLNKNRERFFKLSEKYPFNYCSETVKNDKYDVCYISIFYALNYGSALVSYAIHKLITNLGYTVLTLNKPDYVWKGHPTTNSVSGEFAAKHYNISRCYRDLNELKELNNKCNTFIVGSDQIFHPFLKVEHAYLEFVDLSKNKIAFGTSFGEDKYNKSLPETKKDNYLLNRFNHIALREKTENLCNNIFNLPNAIEIIDPTLLISKTNWNILCQNVYLEEAQKPYLLAYILDNTFEKTDAIKYTANKLGLNIIYIPELNKNYRNECGLEPTRDEYSIEEFLYLYKNATFVMTDSYHGTMFATNYNKPFISVINTRRGAVRYKIIDTLKIKERVVAKPEDIYIPENEYLFGSFNFTETNNIIEEKREFAINWLKNAIENNTSKKYSVQEEYSDYITREQSQWILKLEKNLKIVYNAANIKHKYYRYKILSKILLGKKRKHYKEKAKIWHEKVRLIRNLTKELSKI